MPIEGRRSLLVAAGLGWDPDRGLPVSPTPWAAGPAGWWRHGPSTPFAVSEVRADNVTYFQDFPSPAATIEKMTAADGTTLLPGFTGTRMFVTVVPLADEESGPDVAPSRLEGLTTGAGPNGIATVVRVPIPPGNESGRDGSYATLALGDVRLPGAERTTRWALQVVPINDWGEVGFPVVRTIVRDAVGPTLNMEEPFTSPVWPFQARLPGRSEPGSIGQHRRRRGDPGRRARPVHGRDPPRSVAPDDPAHRDRLIGQRLDRGVLDRRWCRLPAVPVGADRCAGASRGRRREGACGSRPEPVRRGRGDAVVDRDA